MKKLLAILLAVTFLFAGCSPAATTSSSGSDALPTTQEPVWPEPGRDITIVVNYNAGNAHDTMARTIAPFMAKILGCDILIENVPGGSGLVGITKVLNMPDDGYTLVAWAHPKHDIETVVTTDGSAPTYTFEDFDTLGSVMPETHMLVVPANSPYNTLQEVIDAAKAAPNDLLFAGTGTYPGVSGIIWEDIQNKTGTEFEYLPFGGGSPEVIAALLGNHVDIATSGIGDVYESYVKNGQLKALAVCSNERNVLAPDIPSVKEALGIELEAFTGTANRMLMVRGSTPEYIKQKLQDAFYQASQDPEFIEMYEKTGYKVVYMTPEECDMARKGIIEFFETKDK